MSAISRELREALIRIKKDPGLAPFVDHLARELAKEQDAMGSLEAPMVYRAQGRTSYVKDLRKLIDDADKPVVGLSTPQPFPASAGRF